jgi:serralysin
VTYIQRGGEFLVNTQTAGDQFQPSIAALDGGGFVVAWEDASATLGDSAGKSIKGQRYDALGAPVGSEFLINTQTTGSQGQTRVAALNGGGFVVTWVDGSGVSDGSFAGVEGQLFDAVGNRVGGEFHVNTQTFSTQGLPDIARLANGGFVITWSDVVGTSVKAQVFAANGTKVGGELTANTQATGFQDLAKVAGLTGGRFVVAWQDDSGTLGDSSGTSIKAQLYEANGTAVGGEFLVNTAIAGTQGSVDIAALNGGGFVATWSDASSNSGDIKAQLFDAAGAKVGTEFQVNTTLEANTAHPSWGCRTAGSLSPGPIS